ncbi:MAG: hypothetical protein AAF211_16745 [Myxococcota bacterium]
MGISLAFDTAFEEAEARTPAWCAERVPNRAQLAARFGIGERTLYRQLARPRERTS